MLSVRVAVVGGKVTAIGRDLERVVTQSAKETADTIANRARGTVAVETGQTKASIRSRGLKPRDGVSRASVTARGAGLWLEYGTSRMNAQPFIRPSIPGALEQMLAHIRSRLR